MDPEIVDSAIDMLLHDDEDLSSSVIRAIVQEAEGFDAACNLLSLRTAARFVEGHLVFDEAMQVMNWVWSYMNGRQLDTGLRVPEPAYWIYDAFDAGLYSHSGDGPGVDPVARYTVPGLRQILDEASA